jgi:hypothetical protein
MNENLGNGSVFGKGSSMTADQVLVFKTGEPADKMMLLVTLMHHLGMEYRLHSCNDSLIIESESIHYEFGRNRIKITDSLN